MSNFNSVFLAVKRQCERQSRFAELHSFTAIAKEANVPPDKLGTYLNHLQDLGLIRFSMTGPDKYIYLTSLGKKLEALKKRSELT